MNTHIDQQQSEVYFFNTFQTSTAQNALSNSWHAQLNSFSIIIIVLYIWYAPIYDGIFLAYCLEQYL